MKTSKQMKINYHKIYVFDSLSVGWSLYCFIFPFYVKSGIEDSLFSMSLHNMHNAYLVSNLKTNCFCF